MRKLNEREENENSKEKEKFSESERKSAWMRKTTQFFFSAVDTHGHNKEKEKDEIFNHFTEM